eukprot:SAG25_NODE_1149_length_3785_cov_3.788931_6_plen_83_part_00
MAVATAVPYPKDSQDLRAEALHRSTPLLLLTVFAQDKPGYSGSQQEEPLSGGSHGLLRPDAAGAAEYLQRQFGQLAELHVFL